MSPKFNKRKFIIVICIFIPFFEESHSFPFGIFFRLILNGIFLSIGFKTIYNAGNRFRYLLLDVYLLNHASVHWIAFTSNHKLHQLYTSSRYSCFDWITFLIFLVLIFRLISLYKKVSLNLFSKVSLNSDLKVSFYLSSEVSFRSSLKKTANVSLKVSLTLS